MPRKVSKSIGETPPHTWRKPIVTKKSPAVHRKHLHIRGENVPLSVIVPATAETPPHTWRKRFRVFHVFKRFGNTSTYVEKTEIFCIKT